MTKFRTPIAACLLVYVAIAATFSGCASTPPEDDKTFFARRRVATEHYKTEADYYRNKGNPIMADYYANRCLEEANRTNDSFWGGFFRSLIWGRQDPHAPSTPCR